MASLQRLLLVLVISACNQSVLGFVTPSLKNRELKFSSFTHRRTSLSLSHRRQRVRMWRLSASTNDNNYSDDNFRRKDDNGSPLNVMRSLLEASWNEKYMGRVPSDPASAANEAHAAIVKAVDNRGGGGGGGGVFFIDLLLPSYDLGRGGEKLYDEVLAVEYCILLAERLSGNTEILVKNDKTKNVVERVLTARERMATTNQEDDEAEDEDDILDNYVADIESASAVDVDSFRLSLMSLWEGEGGSSNDDADPLPDETKRPALHELVGSKGVVSRTSSSKKYRLASMLGGEEISSNGPEMSQKVIDAVRRNALCKEDEENIIILSPISQQELVAVRGLAAKYAQSKKMILVNCRFDPMPLELLDGETVYSVLPLIAREASSTTTTNKSGESSKTNDGVNSGIGSAPRVVILRRYPIDWEVFVDLGNGFELAGNTPVTSENKRGLSREWIGECVQSYLDSVSRSR